MIRKATIADWPYISEISAISGYEDYINRIGAGYLAQGDVFVNDASAITGFMKVESMPDNSMWISGLRVHPDHRRMNIASDLLQYAYSIARSTGKGYVRALVESTNYKSIGLMKKNGMSIEETFDFYNGGIDTSEYKRRDLKISHLVYYDWRFIKACKGFLASNSALVYADMPESPTYTVIYGSDFTYTDKGSTCAPASYRNSINLKRVDDFPSGELFQRKIIKT
ncbi:MAG: GNAT family N-acetyltransferase [Ferroplasma sp.]